MVPNINDTKAQNKNQKPFKTWNTVCYRVPNKQEPRTIPSRKCNTCVRASLVQLAAKYPRNIESDKNEKLKFEVDKFLELFPDEPKMTNYVTAARSNSVLDQLSHRTLTKFIKVAES